MKHHSLKILVVLLGTFAVFMMYSSLTTKAQTTSPSACVLDSSNIYANPDLDVEGKMSLYHKTMNDKFNAYTKTMIQAGPGNADGVPPELETDCSESNYSTFCVARDLLTNPNYGYMAYTKALTCTKYGLFETTKQKDLWNQYMAGVALSPEDSAQMQSTYQGAKVIGISARLEAIDREVQSSKRALDQTLAAYNELRSAWPLHKKYVEIYSSLVIYRDKMAEIRSQVEDFPAKYIDVTTTKCI